jgi:hypothetical protein
MYLKSLFDFLKYSEIKKFDTFFDKEFTILVNLELVVLKLFKIEKILRKFPGQHFFSNVKVLSNIRLFIKIKI